MMTKEELHALAAPGVAQKVAAIEQELATYHKEWPELFLSPTPPQLLKARQRRNGNGHWPLVAKKATPAPTAIEDARKRKVAATWTPERRALMARLMRKRSKEIHAARAAARKKRQSKDVS
jgi:hypothetical protein